MIETHCAARRLDTWHQLRLPRTVGVVLVHNGKPCGGCQRKKRFSRVRHGKPAGF